VAALVGDLATDNDAVRLARSQAPVRQITTGTVCHLEAAMVRTALEGWDLEQLDYLFIENVGNLVCPATFDLGEELRLVLFSVTEGEDKPLKYPTIFNTADMAIAGVAPRHSGGGGVMVMAPKVDLLMRGDCKFAAWPRSESARASFLPARPVFQESASVVR
jgi:hypothetical protein